MLRKVEFPLLNPKCLMQQCASVNKVPFEQALIVQAQYIECVNANLSVKVLLGYVLAAALCQQLKWENLLIHRVVGNKLRIQNEALNVC